MSAPDSGATGQVKVLQGLSGPTEDWEPALLSLLSANGKTVNMIGVGNPIRGDDAVGIEIVSRLRRSLGSSPSPGLRIHAPSFTPEVTIAKIARMKQSVLVFDAVEANKAPGTILFSRLGETKFGFFATHNLPLKVLPEVAEGIANMYLMGIQPLDLGLGEGLSCCARASCDRILSAVERFVGRGE